ncbi:hypothetical protein [Nocardiopsis coralliicola]
MPRTPLERIGWALTDSRIVARRELVHWVRNPVVILNSLFFPMVMVLLFG